MHQGTCQKEPKLQNEQHVLKNLSCAMADEIREDAT